jgi:DNA-binding MarR family transcriptional regulator
VWDALSRFFQARVPVLRRISEEVGLPQLHLRVLGYLADNRSASAGDLSQYLGVTPAAVTFAIHEMASRGLVRLDSASGDRRRVVVGLRSAGRREVARLTRWRDDYGHRLLGSFSREERAEFARLLTKFAETTSAALAEDGPSARGAGSNSSATNPRRARVHGDPGA